MGVLWLLLCLQRGVLQGLRAYQPVATSIVAEAVGRLVAGSSSSPPGSGVAGALPRRRAMAFDARGALAQRVVHRRAAAAHRRRGAARTLRSLVGDGWAPIVGLLLLASLQNIDVIMAKHR